MKLDYILNPIAPPTRSPLNDNNPPQPSDREDELPPLCTASTGLTNGACFSLPPLHLGHSGNSTGYVQRAVQHGMTNSFIRSQPHNGRESINIANTVRQDTEFSTSMKRETSSSSLDRFKISNCSSVFCYRTAGQDAKVSFAPNKVEASPSPPFKRLRSTEFPSGFVSHTAEHGTNNASTPADNPLGVEARALKPLDHFGLSDSLKSPTGYFAEFDIDNSSTSANSRWNVEHTIGRDTNNSFTPANNGWRLGSTTGQERNDLFTPANNPWSVENSPSQPLDRLRSSTSGDGTVEQDTTPSSTPEENVQCNNHQAPPARTFICHKCHKQVSLKNRADHAKAHKMDDPALAKQLPNDRRCGNCSKRNRRCTVFVNPGAPDHTIRCQCCLRYKERCSFIDPDHATHWSVRVHPAWLMDLAPQE